MPHRNGANAQHAGSEACRKFENQRRMQFRRAIEDHYEELRLRQELTDYPELVATAYLSSSHQGQWSTQRAD